MIFIFRNMKIIDPERLRELEKLAAELNAIQNVGLRKKFIERHSKSWGRVEESLLEMSKGKCWYSEARDVVSDWQVDHFRPKAKYDWLAFDWTNYRIAGCLPNRRKRAEFPLAEGSPCATLLNPDLSAEFVLLLDPTNPNDPNLLTFDETGQPKPSKPDNIAALKRVEVSIDIFNLNSVRLREARQQVWRDCREKIDRLRAALERNHYLEAEFINEEALIRGSELRRMTAPSAQFSSTAKACIRAHSIEWVYELPEPHESAVA